MRCLNTLQISSFSAARCPELEENGFGRLVEGSNVFPGGPCVDQPLLENKSVPYNLTPTVDASTGVTEWRGESCDYSIAMDVLLQRDGKT